MMSIRETTMFLPAALAISSCVIGSLPFTTASAPTAAEPASPAPTAPEPAPVPTEPLVPSPLPVCSQPPSVGLDEMELAFVADWDADGEIYTIQADGSGLVQVTDNETQEALPRWSPDGRQLAYIDDQFGTSRLVVSNADGSNASRVATDLEATWGVVWSPTGRQVVFRSSRSQNWHLFSVDVQTGDVVNLTRGAQFTPYGHPSFSPEGDRMVVGVRMPDNAGPPEIRLFIVRADGTGLTELSFPAGDADDWPVWNPLTDEILFQGLVRGQGVGLYVASPDGPISRLKAEPEYLLSYPSWSPDGTMIAYVALETPQATALHVATKNEDVDEIVLGADMMGEEWFGLNRHFWAPDNRHIAFFGSGGAYSADAVFVFDICEGQPRIVVEDVRPDSEVSWRPLTASRPSDTASPMVVSTPTEGPFDFSTIADQWRTYQNNIYGFAFEYPAVYAEGPYSFCAPREFPSQDGVTVTVGMRSDLSIFDAQGQTLQEYVDGRIADLQSGDPYWELASRKETTHAGVDAISIDYRFGGLSRIGSALVLKRGSDLYLFSFTFGAFCDVPETGLYEWDVYPRMVNSFKWLDQ